MIQKLIKSFGFAFQGLLYTIKTQRNFRIHLIATFIVLCCSAYYHIEMLEFLILLICIGLVLFAELVNTSIETIVDLVSPDYHKLAKITKDTAAASVLVLVMISALIGTIIFLPYIF